MHLINATALRLQVEQRLATHETLCEKPEQLLELLDAAIKNCEQFGIDSLNPRVVQSASG